MTLFLNKRLLIYEDNNNNQKSNISKQIDSKENWISIHLRRVILKKICCPKLSRFVVTSLWNMTCCPLRLKAGKQANRKKNKKLHFGGQKHIIQLHRVRFAT